MLISSKLALVWLPIWALLAARGSAGLFSRLCGRGAQSAVQEYNLLNSLLVNRVYRETALPNLLAALDWLKMATGELKAGPDEELPPKRALLRFTSLLKLMDPEKPRCDMEAYAILSENQHFAGTTVMLPPDELGPLRRIDAVIHEVALQHANMCRYVYPHLFLEALEGASEEAIQSIESMMAAIIATNRKVVFVAQNRPMELRRFVQLKAKGVSVTDYAVARALLVELRQRSREDADSCYLRVKPDPRRRNRWIVDEGKVAEMLQRYVYTRCEYLERTFAHIWTPAEFEQRLFPYGYKYRAITNSTAEFMVWLQYYRLCGDMMKNKRKLEDNVVKAIWSELQ